MIFPSFHIHTFRCRHATGDVADFARVASEKGLARLGISDHTPLPDGRWPETRMPMSQLDDYLGAIVGARKAFPGLEILAGMECEYADFYEGYYRDVLLGEKKLDYLIGAWHFIPRDGHWFSAFEQTKDRAALRFFCEYAIASMESGLFTFIAHPDLFFASYPAMDDESRAVSRDIIACAKSHNLPLEINGNGMWKKVRVNGVMRRPYPHLPFWELAAEMGAKVIVNSDAHAVDEIFQYMDEGKKIADDLGLERVELPFR